MNKVVKLSSLLFSSIAINFAYAEGAITSAPAPTVFLSGNNQEMSLAQQISKTMPAEDVVNAPPQNFSTSEIGNQVTGFEPQIVSYNNAINTAFKKFSTVLVAADPGDKAIAYIEFKQAQQTNLMLQQQNRLLKIMTEMNANLEVIISQNNRFFKENMQNKSAKSKAEFDPAEKSSMMISR
jgi:hypothetical protein